MEGGGIEGGVEGVVERLVGVQGQERGAAELAWQPRSRGLVQADVTRALDGVEQEGGQALVRTWAMRGTLHVLAAADVGWLLDLLGPIFVARGRRRRKQLGLDDATYERGVAILREALHGGKGMTRAEIAARLEAEGVAVEWQALYHLLARAGLEAVICYGAERAGEQCFVLLDEWAPFEQEEMSHEAAVQRLARRYLAGYGPASAQDFASWSGLGVREARSGLEAVGERLAAGGEALFDLESGESWEEPAGAPLQARLLPAYDSFLLGYASRSLVVRPAYERAVHPGGGVIRPALLVGGVAAGTWRLRKGRVELSLFAPLQGEAAEAAAQAVVAMEAYVAGK